jgi:hypothetical protein
MYNGNQWDGAKLGNAEPIQLNFIKPIVKYKVSVIHDNLYAINYSSQNYENPSFRRAAEKYCEMLNGYAARVWEKDKLDFKGRKITVDAAVNDEGIIYVNFDEESKMPINEIIKKNDIYYGNENDDDIQAQPYILIRKRMPVLNAIDFAIDMGMSEDKLQYIVGDTDRFDESGEAAKEELDDMVTIIYKMYKEKGTVRFSVATRYADICEDVDIGISLYPVAHFNWEEREGSARGEGETRYLIPNQLEVNKILMRRSVSVGDQAYPLRIYDTSKIANPKELGRVGGIIKTNGTPVDDVNKIVGTLHPAQMSPDVKLLQEDLVQITRELAGAGDSATGQINPEDASGRAILAVQNASRAPMTSQREAYKNFIEDIAKIWLEYLIVYSKDGINLENKVTDPMTGEETIQMVNVPQSALQQLKASVKIDVTPKSVYDRFAAEQTMENFLLQGFFNAQRISEFKAYVEALPDDSVAPKLRLQEVIDRIEEEQRRIAQIEAQAQEMQQRAEQFLMSTPNDQADTMANAEMELMARREAAQRLQQEQGNMQQ